MNIKISPINAVSLLSWQIRRVIPIGVEFCIKNESWEHYKNICLQPWRLSLMFYSIIAKKKKGFRVSTVERWKNSVYSCLYSDLCWFTAWQENIWYFMSHVKHWIILNASHVRDCPLVPVLVSCTNNCENITAWKAERLSSDTDSLWHSFSLPRLLIHVL